jgi:two-component system, response regulator PdtaR
VSAATILVVEDQPLIRMSLAETLEGAGFKVLEAADAGTGFRAMLDADCVELVIADVGLPGEMNGVTLAEAVIHHWPSTRIIVISGRPDAEELSLPPQAAFMPKPVAPSVLLNKVAEMLS